MQLSKSQQEILKTVYYGNYFFLEETNCISTAKKSIQKSILRDVK